MNTNPASYSDDTGRKALWYVIAAALVLRVITALVSDSFNHPDENFQIMEQAHRLVFGYGIIPWEYRLAARSWLVPGVMAGFLYPFKLIGLDNPNIYIPAIKLLMSLLSIIVLWSAYSIGRVLHSVRAGILSALLCAIWYECIYFSIRPLSEVWAANIFVLSVALFLTSNDSIRKTVLAGFLAALAMAIRINYIPVVIVFMAILTMRLGGRLRKVCLLSFFGTILLVGIFEWLTLGGFYISYINLYEIDKTFFMAGNIGSSFSWDYLLFLGYGSMFIYWIFIISGFWCRRQNWPILIIILTALVTHLLIPAKPHEIDYRHIFVIIPFIMILGGISLAELGDIITRIRKYHLSISFIIVFVAIVSIAGAFGVIPGQQRVYNNKPFEVYNHSIFYSSPRLEAYRYMYNHEPMAGVYDASGAWFRSGGFYYLHRDVPLYFGDNPPISPDYVSHILTRSTLPPSMGFGLAATFDDIKVYVRSDKNYQHKINPDYTRNIYQKGVDDRILMTP